MLAALTHRLAGVGRDDIMAYFLRTNDPAHLERMKPIFAAHIAETAGRTPRDAAILVATGVEAHYLEAASEEIAARHGSSEEHLGTVLGVDDGEGAAIEARLLE